MQSSAAQALELQKFLNDFYENPKKMMGHLPEIRDRSGHITRPSKIPSDREKNRIESLIPEKSRIRSRMSAARLGAIRLESSYDRANDPELFLGIPSEKIIRKLARMPQSAKLAEIPWSDSYWPTYMGILGQRYADNGFPFSMNWKENFSATHGAFSAPRLWANEGGAVLDRLSPSEKYDFLIGPLTVRQSPLTRGMWEQGEMYFREFGEVARWMGICHGWAPASYFMPRPERSVKVIASDGKTELTFRPSDIKGLASLLWAETDPPNRFVGSRCAQKDPKTDANGRIIEPDCFDTNPGAWHTIIVNQIARIKKHFVMDANYDDQVWNQPVYSYTYTLFNPITKESVDTVEKAMVKKSDFIKDPFSAYRSSQTSFIVGVNMTVFYAVETSPSTQSTVSAQDDDQRSAEYIYDLELNSAGQIMGGEWYTAHHPDFLWQPISSRTTTASDDEAAGEWNLGQPLPYSWQRAAESAATLRQPLAKIVEALIEASH